MNTKSAHYVLRGLSAGILAMLLATVTAAQVPDASEHNPELSTDTTVATAGYFQLRWNAAEPIRLVESTSADFTNPVVVYTGEDSGHMVSGRADGELHYRLESAATGAPLGAPVRVVVAHHPLGRALGFFAVGAVVFLATATMILVAGRRSAT